MIELRSLIGAFLLSVYILTNIISLCRTEMEKIEKLRST